MLSLVLLVVERPVFLKLYLSIPTLKLLFMLVVVKEVMKWQKSCTISQNLPLKMTKEMNNVLCKEPAWLLILQICLSPLEKLLFIQELLWLSISEIKDIMLV